MATVEDAEVVARLGACIQEIHHENRPDWFKSANAQDAVALYKKLLSNSTVTTFLAELGEDLVGFVMTKVFVMQETPLVWEQTIVEISQIGVVPSARRSGVGRELLMAVRQLADSISVSCIQLTTWEFNAVAYRFFESEGLEIQLRRMSMPYSAD
ncbi:MAG: GNAT family N-acetyltransferase [Acidimicrobiaceae bacterium]|nr:GNAT family N-acetyltransferase [Acidimicrobiaceae bacterium]